MGDVVRLLPLFDEQPTHHGAAELIFDRAGLLEDPRDAA